MTLILTSFYANSIVCPITHTLTTKELLTLSNNWQVKSGGVSGLDNSIQREVLIGNDESGKVWILYT